MDRTLYALYTIEWKYYTLPTPLPNANPPLPPPSPCGQPRSDYVILITL